MVQEKGLRVLFQSAAILGIFSTMAPGAFAQSPSPKNTQLGASPSCDAEVTGSLSFLEFQGLINSVTDQNQDGILQICLAKDAHITNPAGSNDYIFITRDHVRILGSKVGPAVFENLNEDASPFASLNNSVFRVTNVDEFVLSDVEVRTQGQFAFGLLVQASDQVDLRNIAIKMTGMGAQGVFVESSQIETMENFRILDRKPALDKFTTGIGVTTSSIKSMKNILVEQLTHGIALNGGAMVDSMQRLSVKAANRIVAGVGVGYGSTVGEMRDIHLDLHGGGVGMSVFQGAQISLIEGLTVLRQSYSAAEEEIFVGVSIGNDYVPGAKVATLRNLVVSLGADNGDFVDGVLVAGANLGALENFLITNEGVHSTTVPATFLTPDSGIVLMQSPYAPHAGGSIDLIQNGEIQTKNGHCIDVLDFYPSGTPSSLGSTAGVVCTTIP